MKIKAISLHQPWASLVAIGAKRFETRGWSTKHRGPLAIHAAQRWTKDQQRLCDAPRFYESLFPTWNKHVLPLGCIVAVCDLTGCFSADLNHPLSPPTKIDEKERAFGDWSPGRFAWRLENVRRIEPVPCNGRQGFFWVELPDAA